MRFSKILVLMIMMFCFLMSISAMAADPPPACWKNTITRGVGRVPNCTPDKVKDAGLCYPPCPAGFKGVGPVCWQSCPAGYKDDGATCRKDADIFGKDSYDRGVGRVIPCRGDYPEYDAGLCYKKCNDGYKGVATRCYRYCPEGYKDDGATCRKDANIFGKQSKTRGVGTVGNYCPPDKPQFQAGLCYKPCPGNYKGVGPVCWRNCTNPNAKAKGVNMPTECGAACATDKNACQTFTTDLVKAGLKMVVDVVKAIATADPEPLADLPEDFQKFMDTPLCE